MKAAEFFWEKKLTNLKQNEPGQSALQSDKVFQRRWGFWRRGASKSWSGMQGLEIRAILHLSTSKYWAGTKTNQICMHSLSPILKWYTEKFKNCHQFMWIIEMFSYHFRRWFFNLIARAWWTEFNFWCTAPWSPRPWRSTSETFAARRFQNWEG